MFHQFNACTIFLFLQFSVFFLLLMYTQGGEKHLKANTVWKNEMFKC